ncbi:uncharacterized protein DUF1861 [Halanaerobium saccharolyticum]|uniref:Uncharacterized protein DUF1861 n=1 Tax=Halanaerobium saccharolyticum TaxID=43595 RepID=A0A4R7YXF9_9FIRM|nr:DUF1861 family protein [Halanaerobium saccharolyticum]RAK06317.1 uncharacterized protein DUF1861 [Halanaerobium saccharolyticum]TDW00796.1 uncharacterized protein DUF1861 [Halanaerobium saccharolyticum]TDX52438.1 uncharacterized protein DUF1861 [Halanaerobium saccharolyticum]
MTKKSCKKLLKEYKLKNNQIKAEKINFRGVNNYDVYNITAPFINNKEEVIAGRVEKRDSEDAKVLFFKKTKNDWEYDRTLKEFQLQDPFITQINSELIFGGVKIIKDREAQNIISWKTKFYRGSSINELKLFAEGPEGMKDIRLIELPDKRIGVFTRPQGEIGGRGTIGFTIINNLNELNKEIINNAALLDNQFLKEEWGGVNEVHVLKNDQLGVLGHIASFDQDGNRHYYPITFAFDYKDKKSSDVKIIAKRSELPEGPAKRDDLKDVLFSGGIIRKNYNKAELYLGVSDAEAYKLEIADPFIEYENSNLF